MQLWTFFFRSDSNPPSCKASQCLLPHVQEWWCKVASPPLPVLSTVATRDSWVGRWGSEVDFILADFIFLCLFLPVLSHVYDQCYLHSSGFGWVLWKNNSWLKWLWRLSLSVQLSRERASQILVCRAGGHSFLVALNAVSQTMCAHLQIWKISPIQSLGR